ncbi:MAG: glycoside hydrolase domain-containing protein [Jatrophihabitantaceae bacterium]
MDSTVAIDARSLANVRGYYRGGNDPVVWGRYLLGRFGLHRAEIAFAAAHGIVLYLLVPDANCSGCVGGDLCGNDRSASQAVRDAQQATAAAQRLGVPAGVTLFKDIEEVGACHTELTASYLDAWFGLVQHSHYRAGFYGNATAQDYDFPRAYCAAARLDPLFRREVILAQNEPEPMIGAPRGTIGPSNAPPFTPDRPSCAPVIVTKIWQYGESLNTDNLTDVDEVQPDTPGLLMPDGSATSPS